MQGVIKPHYRVSIPEGTIQSVIEVDRIPIQRQFQFQRVQFRVHVPFVTIAIGAFQFQRVQFRGIKKRTFQFVYDKFQFQRVQFRAEALQAY